MKIMKKCNHTPRRNPLAVPPKWVAPIQPHQVRFRFFLRKKHSVWLLISVVTTTSEMDDDKLFIHESAYIHTVDKIDNAQFITITKIKGTYPVIHP